MPRKFSIADKKKWLEKYERGKSDVFIARESKCDARTVKNGIAEARREQDAQLARSELLKHALLKHQESLLGKLTAILSIVTLPPTYWEPLSWYHNGDSIFSKNGLAIAQPYEVSEEIQGSDGKPDMVQDMLEQHLKRDKLWKYLAQWEKAYDAHRSKRIALQLKVAALLQEETGCQMVDRDVDQDGSAIKPPFLYSYNTGPLLFKMTLNYTFKDNYTDKWKDRIVADAAAGNVRDGPGTILAAVPGKEKECRQNLLDAFEKMKALPECAEVKSSSKELEKTIPRVRQAIDEILLLGLILGSCKVCQRLGM